MAVDQESMQLLASMMEASTHASMSLKEAILQGTLAALRSADGSISDEGLIVNPQALENPT